MPSDKYQNKYRSASARCPGWDYASNGSYFITICTHGRVHCFGHIVANGNGVQTMEMTDLGRQAHQCAMDIPLHFPFVTVDEFVIMPNHVHLLFTIKRVGGNERFKNVCDIVKTTTDDDMVATVGTQNFASLQTQPLERTQNIASQQKKTPPPVNAPCNHFGPQSQNVASIVRGFKIGVTKYARERGMAFEWQARFHDHIVRNDDEYWRIRRYIQNNVQHWDVDSLK